MFKLTSNSVGDSLDRAQMTLTQRLEEIHRGLNGFYSQSHSARASIACLKSDVSWLKLSCLHPHRDFLELESKLIVDLASETFSNKFSPTVDRILAVKLIIISKILQHLTKPEDAVLYCLQWLQKLNEVHSLPVSESYKVAESILNVNQVLFQFVRMFLKPPPSTKEWPVTIQLHGRIYNPLIDGELLKERLTGGSKVVPSPVKSDLGCVGSKEEDPVTDVEEYDAQIMEGLSDRYIDVVFFVNLIYFALVSHYSTLSFFFSYLHHG